MAFGLYEAHPIDLLREELLAMLVMLRSGAFDWRRAKAPFSVLLSNFDQNDAGLTDELKGSIEQLALVLLEHPQLEIDLVVGRASQTGSESNNVTLSSARASTVATELTRLGVYPPPPTMGVGSSEPIQNLPGVESELNRSVEIRMWLAGLDGIVLAGGPGDGLLVPDLTVPRDQVSPFLWRDLIEFQVPQDVLDMLGNRNMSSLSLEGASGGLINLDYFPIRITKLPVVDGEQLTANQFLEFVRRNLHTDKIIQTMLGQFSPYAAEDDTLWFSDNPYKSVLRIDLLGPDNAAVVCAKAAADHWVFHTVATPIIGGTGAHPVSGQRMFGYLSPTPGEFVFFTRGADRVTGIFDKPFSKIIFTAGELVWESFQSRVANFVNSNGGAATVLQKFSHRYAWPNVIGALRAQP